jgi:hypothetical protein
MARTAKPRRPALERCGVRLPRWLITAAGGVRGCDPFVGQVLRCPAHGCPLEPTPNYCLCPECLREGAARLIPSQDLAERLLVLWSKQKGWRREHDPLPMRRGVLDREGVPARLWRRAMRAVRFARRLLLWLAAHEMTEQDLYGAKAHA